jgi:hypothetical protein
MSQNPVFFKTASAFNNRLLVNLYAQAADHQRLKLRVCSLLPENIAKQVLHCAIKNRKLLIYTHSPLWASQLRFYQPTLLANLTQVNAERVDSMQIKTVAMQSGISESIANQAAIPSAATIGIIQKQCACVSDNQLQQALLKLSATLKKLSAEA